MCKKGRTGTRGHQEVAHATLKGGTVANAANNDTSPWSAIANAHAALARPCELKSPMRCSAAALEYPPQALNVGKIRKHMNRDQCKT